jgi:hypothetical protein
LLDTLNLEPLSEDDFDIEKMSETLKERQDELAMTESEAKNVRKGSGWKVFKRFEADTQLPDDFVSSVRTPTELAVSECPLTRSSSFLTEADMPKPPLSDNGKFKPVPEVRRHSWRPPLPPIGATPSPPSYTFCQVRGCHPSEPSHACRHAWDWERQGSEPA